MANASSTEAGKRLTFHAYSEGFSPGSPGMVLTLQLPNPTDDERHAFEILREFLREHGPNDAIAELCVYAALRSAGPLAGPITDLCGCEGVRASDVELRAGFWYHSCGKVLTAESAATIGEALGIVKEKIE